MFHMVLNMPLKAFEIFSLYLMLMKGRKEGILHFINTDDEMDFN